jgi:hypothetical protein
MSISSGSSLNHGRVGGRFGEGLRRDRDGIERAEIRTTKEVSERKEEARALSACSKSYRGCRSQPETAARLEIGDAWMPLLLAIGVAVRPKRVFDSGGGLGKPAQRLLQRYRGGRLNETALSNILVALVQSVAPGWLAGVLWKSRG